jgi:hypothetical protein
VTTHPGGTPLIAPTPAALQDLWQLADPEITRMLALVREVGRAELKVIVSEISHDAVCAALGADPAGARPRRVYYLDNQDLVLRRHGLLIRVRSGAGRPADSVVKLRPLVPGAVPAAVRRSGDFTAEVDLTPGGFVCSGSLKSSLGVRDVDRIVTRGRKLESLFSPRQHDLLTTHAPEISFDKLCVFGPVDVRRIRLQPEVLGHSMELQQWNYPDGTTLLELSTRSTAEQLLPVTTRTARFLERHEIRRSEPRPTKADTTLDFFAQWRTDE